MLSAETGIDHSARRRAGINCFSFNRKMHCGIVRRRSTVHFYVYVSNESGSVLTRDPGGISEFGSLFVHNFQYIHRTGFCADTAGNTFGSRIVLGFYDQAKWTGLRTGSASRTFFLVDHVNALRVLGNGAFRTGLGTFTALRTGDRADSLFLYDLQTCLVRIKYLIKCLRTCSHTGKTSHTGTAFFNFQFFHLFYPPLKVCVFLILPFLIFFLNDISGICHYFPTCDFSSIFHFAWLCIATKNLKEADRKIAVFLRKIYKKKNRKFVMMKEKNVLSSISQNQEWKDFGSTQ